MSVSRALSRKLLKLKAAMGKQDPGLEDDSEPTDPDQFYSISFDQCEEAGGGGLGGGTGSGVAGTAQEGNSVLHLPVISHNANPLSSSMGSVMRPEESIMSADYSESSSNSSACSSGSSSDTLTSGVPSGVGMGNSIGGSGMLCASNAGSAMTSGANSIRTSPNATMVNLTALNPAASIIREVELLPKLERTPSGNTLHSGLNETSCSAASILNASTNSITTTTTNTTILSTNKHSPMTSPTNTTFTITNPQTGKTNVKHLSQLSTSSIGCESLSEEQELLAEGQDEEAQADQMALYILEKVRCSATDPESAVGRADGLHRRAELAPLPAWTI